MNNLYKSQSMRARKRNEPAHNLLTSKAPRKNAMPVRRPALVDDLYRDYGVRPSKSARKAPAPHRLQPLRKPRSERRQRELEHELQELIRDARNPVRRIAKSPRAVRRPSVSKAPREIRRPVCPAGQQSIKAHVRTRKLKDGSVSVSEIRGYCRKLTSVRRRRGE